VSNQQQAQLLTFFLMPPLVLTQPSQLPCGFSKKRADS